MNRMAHRTIAEYVGEKMKLSPEVLEEFVRGSTPPQNKAVEAEKEIVAFPDEGRK